MQNLNSQVHYLYLTEPEAQAVDNCSRSALKAFGEVNEAAFLRTARIMATDLPVRVRRALAIQTASLTRPNFLVIRNHQVDQAELGTTPRHWRQGSATEQARRYDFLTALYGAALGEIFGWRTQQDGRIIHDVLPIESHEHEQLGSGSREELTLHTEDAFHEYRADYLILFALRNPDSVATTVVNVDWIEDRDPILFEPRFLITPDESHLPKNNSEATDTADWPIDTEPSAISILRGDPAAPFMRADPYFMRAPAGDDEAKSALGEFSRHLTEQAIGVVLHPGDLAVIDNHRFAHGRRPFRARYNGKDRWLKRANVTADLRRSVHLHHGSCLL